MFPVWIYIVAALSIALTAFGLGQLVPGLGMGFATLASLLWTVYCVSRARRSTTRS